MCGVAHSVEGVEKCDCQEVHQAEILILIGDKEVVLLYGKEMHESALEVKVHRNGQTYNFPLKSNGKCFILTCCGEFSPQITFLKTSFGHFRGLI